MKGRRTRATIVFIGLAIVFAILAFIAKLVFAGDGFSQGLLLAIGAAVFASGFTFFLIETFFLLAKKERAL